jgi:hypothetical protein
VSLPKSLLRKFTNSTRAILEAKDFISLMELAQAGSVDIRLVLANALKQENLILGKEYFQRGSGQMNIRDMLEIIETSSWIPKKNADREKSHNKE